MNAYIFYKTHGKEKCLRIIDDAPENSPLFARYYSDETGSYHNKSKNNSVSIKELRKAANDFRDLEFLQNRINKELLK